MDDDVEPREFLKSRHLCKTGEELLEAAGVVPDELNSEEKMEYTAIAERESVITYEKVTKKGEQFNVHPESSSNPVYFNQQIDDGELAALRNKCSAKQFVEAVKMLPEFNFSTEETWKQVKVKSRSSPCFECGVAGCFRQQQRWQGRVLHGCYPNEKLTEFQHDRNDLVPSCYFVRSAKDDQLSMKYKDVTRDFKMIERGGKEYTYDV